MANPSGRHGLRMRQARAGFTLIELGIVSVLFALMFGTLLRLAVDGQEAFEVGLAQNRLDAKARRTIARIADDLRSAEATGLTPAVPSGSDAVLFRQNQGWNAGEIQWGPDVQIAFADAPGEVVNGLDDNGNGLVDDGEVVRILNPGLGEQRVVLVRGVARLAAGETMNGLDDNGNGLIDEPGLSFELVERSLVVRLTLEQALPGGGTIVSSVETAVALQN